MKKTLTCIAVVELALATFFVGSRVGKADEYKPTCYSKSKINIDGVCKTTDGEECGHTIVVDGEVAATGFKSITGCGGSNGKYGKASCSGGDVGPCN